MLNIELQEKINFSVTLEIPRKINLIIRISFTKSKMLSEYTKKKKKKKVRSGVITSKPEILRK